MSDEELLREWLTQGRAVLITTNSGHPQFTAICLTESPLIEAQLVLAVEHDDCPIAAVRRLMGSR